MTHKLASFYQKMHYCKIDCQQNVYCIIHSSAVAGGGGGGGRGAMAPPGKNLSDNFDA